MRVAWLSHSWIHGQAVVLRLGVHTRSGGSSESRVDGVEGLGVVGRTGGSCGGCVAGRRGRRVTLGDLTLVICGRRWGLGGHGRRRGMLCWSSVGRGLYLRRAGLLLENGVVAKTLAFALLAISAGGMGFVALCSKNVSACVIGVARSS